MWCGWGAASAAGPDQDGSRDPLWFGSIYLGQEELRGSALLAICGQEMTVLSTPVETRGEDLSDGGGFRSSGEGQTVPFVPDLWPLASPVPRGDRSGHALPGPEVSGPNGAAAHVMKVWPRFVSVRDHAGRR